MHLAVGIQLNDIDSYILKELSILLYEQSILSFGKARQLSKLTKWEFHNELGKRKIERHYEIKDLNGQRYAP
jgi:predicted HTH domain antitoxin